VLAYPSGPMVPSKVPPQKDWLVHPEVFSGKSKFSNIDYTHIKLSNGLISRTFLLEPNFVTVGYMNEMTGLNYWRAPKPEAQFKVEDSMVVLVGAVDGSSNNQALWQPQFYKLGVPSNSVVFVNCSVETAHTRLSKECK